MADPKIKKSWGRTNETINITILKYIFLNKNTLQMK